MTTKIDLTLHEGGAATPVLRGAGKLKAGQTYTLTVTAVKVGRGRVALYPQPCDFSKSGRLKVTVTQAKRSKRTR